MSDKDIARVLYKLTATRPEKVTPYWLVGRHRHEWHKIARGIDKGGRFIYEDVCIICGAVTPKERRENSAKYE